MAERRQGQIPDARVPPAVQPRVALDEVLPRSRVLELAMCESSDGLSCVVEAGEPGSDGESAQGGGLVQDLQLDARDDVEHERGSVGVGHVEYWGEDDGRQRTR